MSNRKLTDSQVVEARRAFACGESAASISRRINIGHNTAIRMLRGDTYKSVAGAVENGGGVPKAEVLRMGTHAWIEKNRIMRELPVRKCTHCGEEKDTSEFRGPLRCCKRCWKDRDRLYRAFDRDGENLRQRQRLAKRYERRMADQIAIISGTLKDRERIG